MASAEAAAAERAGHPTQFALIIGAMKSGTTSLFEILAQHPQIAASSIKEPQFFSNLDTYSKGVDWYFGLWDWDSTSHRIALEASPAYTTYPARPGVPQRVANVEGVSFRFIYILRNPIAQIESNVRHTLYSGWGTPVDEGIPEWMIETVSYSMQLEVFLEVFPREHFLLVTLEEFAKQPDVVLRRICSFLGVEETFTFRKPQERYNTGDLYEIGGFWARVVKSDRVRWLANQLLPRRLRHHIRSRLTRISRARSDLGRYSLTCNEVGAVIKRLSADLQRLEQRYGVLTDRYWGIHDGRLLRDAVSGGTRDDA